MLCLRVFRDVSILESCNAAPPPISRLESTSSNSPRLEVESLLHLRSPNVEVIDNRPTGRELSSRAFSILRFSEADRVRYIT